MGRFTIQLLLAGVLFAGTSSLLAANKQFAKAAALRQEPPVEKSADGVAEAHLIEIYKLIGNAQNREALVKAGKLVEDLPSFQLAQLVYGDLLTAQTRALKNFGDVPDTSARLAGTALNELREESVRRIRALRERPTPGTVPSQFLAIMVMRVMTVGVSRVKPSDFFM